MIPLLGARYETTAREPQMLYVKKGGLATLPDKTKGYCDYCGQREGAGDCDVFASLCRRHPLLVRYTRKGCS